MLGLAAVGAFLALGGQASAATFANPGPIAIPTGPGNANPYPSPVTVSGLVGNATDVNVTLHGYSHTFPDDVGVALVAPNGDSLLLMDGAGSTLDDAVNATLTFDDSAAARLSDSSAPTTGSWKPTAYYASSDFPSPGPGSAYANPGPAGGGIATLASTFGGDPPNGTWNLFVRDFATGDGGSIAGGWSLDISTLTRQLTVTVNGTGTGTVTGPGIDCPGDCAELYPDGANVALTATTTGGSAFEGFSGACTGTGTCSLTMTADRAVTATFAAPPPPPPSPYGEYDEYGENLQFRLVRRKVARNGKRARLVVQVPGPGALKAVDARARAGKRPKALIKRARAVATNAGRLPLTVRLSRAGIRKLRHAGKAKVKIRIAYRPTVGSPASLTTRVKFKKR